MGIPDWLQIGGLVVTAAAGIAAVTPTKADDKLVNSVLRIVNVLGLNIFKAKNADDK